MSEIFPYDIVTQKPKFKIGDKITYKDLLSLPNKQYYYGGSNHFMNIGTIRNYGRYIQEKGCYVIGVTCNSWMFTMLESEFLEYDEIKIYNPFTTMLLKRKQFKKDNNGKSRYEIKHNT